MNQPIRYRTESLRDTLEDDIVNGRLKPGQRLEEASLTERFRVSRTPVREALRQLAATGLVEIVPKRGTYVTELALAQLVEMFEVMAELEAMCGRLSARRITTQQGATLNEALEACRRAAHQGDTDRYYYENERFHQVIYSTCGNGFLAQQAQQLHSRLKPYRRLQLRVPDRMRKSLAEHEAIVEAILAGDAKGAETRLREHVAIQGERFTDFVASLRGNAA